MLWFTDSIFSCVKVVIMSIIQGKFSIIVCYILFIINYRNSDTMFYMTFKYKL
jgi:hypothetical protein